MKTTEEDGPVEFTGILLGEEVSGAFAVKEAEGLAVAADDQLATTRVDLGSGKVADFGPM